MEKFLVFVIVVAVVVIGVIFLMSQKSSNQNNLNLNLSPSPNQTTSVSPTKSASTSASDYLYPESDWVTNATEASIHTQKGDIVIELYPTDAPKTVTNFATLSKMGYYNNLTFHRVEPGFVIQGGDPNGNGTGGRSIYGPAFEDELNPNTPSYKEGYKEGVVAMANSGPNTNGSQFFIMLADNATLPKNYTIFGKVT